MSGGRNLHRCVPALSSDLGRRRDTRARSNFPRRPSAAPQTRTRALRDLPVLLRRPAIAPAELAQLHLHPDLSGQDHLLVGLSSRARCPTLRAPRAGPQPLELGARHRRARAARLPSQRDSRLDRGLHRAAARERAPAIVDPRDEALLEHVRDVRAAREAPAADGRARSARASPGCSSPRGPPCATGGDARAAGARAWRAPPAPPPRPGRTRARARRRQRASTLVFDRCDRVDTRVCRSRAPADPPPNSSPLPTRAAAPAGRSRAADERHRPPPRARPPPAAQPARALRRGGDQEVRRRPGGAARRADRLLRVRLAVPAAARARDGARLRAAGRPDRAARDPQRRARAVPDHQRPARNCNR